MSLSPQISQFRSFISYLSVTCTPPGASDQQISFNCGYLVLNMLKVDGVDLLLFLIVVFYVICCPFTKVEESFNMQATHDILQFGTKLSYYDHLEFPGVVPRTFIGSLLIAAFSYPIHILLDHLNVPVLYNQIACRCVLGLVSCLSVAHFRNGVTSKFGERASQLTGLLLVFQFHMCFYMSRTLPNVFALALCLNAFAFWLKVKTTIVYSSTEASPHSCRLFAQTYILLQPRCSYTFFSTRESPCGASSCSRRPL